MKRRMARDITRFDEDKRRSRRRSFYFFSSPPTRQDTYFRDSFRRDGELFVSSRILNGQISQYNQQGRVSIFLKLRASALANIPTC